MSNSNSSSASNLYEDVYKEFLANQNLQIVAIIVAVIVVLLTFVIVRLLTSKSSRRSVLLVGLTDAGKTLMYTQLLTKRFVSTVTSMKENEGYLRLTRKSVNLVDLPGYDRLFPKYFDDHKSRAKAILFVLDASLFTQNIKDVADLLYTILVDEHVRSSRLPVMIACNKQDETRAKSVKVVQNQLEKEINAIREARVGALGSTSGDDMKAILGRLDRPFVFAELKQSIEFSECSALGVKDENGDYKAQLDTLRDWLEKVA